MSLTIKTRDQFVQDEVTAIQASLPQTFLFPKGSVVRAFVDGHSSTAIWLQANQQFLYNRERLATSTGADADSFVNDFDLERLVAVAAIGIVTFASYTATTQRVVVVGSTVSVADGSVSFAVYADTANPNFNPDLNGYVLTIGTPSIDVPVRATAAGIIGNVNSGKITVINSPIVGVDTVINSAAFVTGRDQQSDAELRKYFVDYLNSLSKATKTAITFAIESYQEGLEFVLVENKNYTTGDEQLGFFFAVVDDGSGNPPDSLIDGIRNAVDLVRGLTIAFDIKKPELINIDISAQIQLPSGYTNPILVQYVTDALETYINLLPFGSTLYYTRIPQIIFNALRDLAPTLIDQFNVINISLNGGTSNITSTVKQSFKPHTITITT
jgi:uncharacterized phage protein gp47/JayE